MLSASVCHGWVSIEFISICTCRILFWLHDYCLEHLLDLHYNPSCGICQETQTGGKERDGLLALQWDYFCVPVQCVQGNLSLPKHSQHQILEKSTFRATLASPEHNSTSEYTLVLMERRAGGSLSLPNSRGKKSTLIYLLTGQICGKRETDGKSERHKRGKK